MKNTIATTLDQLSVGQSAEITDVSGGPLRQRLLDIGLTPRTAVTLLRTAPLGDPLELSLRGYQLTLRRTDAALIAVKPL